jgi:poly(3-hydroxybutyrate) depolymerase
MHRSTRLIAVCLAAAWTLLPGMAFAGARIGRPKPPQETGFLNRRVHVRGGTYRFQVYLPEDWRHDDGKRWPIILFLHGRGERGSEGMWQTQIGLPEAVRDHPERWPFIVVMPQCPQGRYWTDALAEELALTALDQEIAEFHADPERTYLTGISLGGYGAWELARLRPHRWAAVTIAAGGIFWSYAPERWKQAATLPTEYARALGRTPIWLFHGADDSVVVPRQDELIYEAFKASGGRIRLWLYKGLKHDCWSRAYDEAELPRWLLEHHLEAAVSQGKGGASARGAEPSALAERLVIPLHPPSIHLTPAQIDNLEGEYLEPNGYPALTILSQGDRLYGKDRYGQLSDLAAESPSVLFYPWGSSVTRLIAQRDSDGRIVAIVMRDDRHEERWEKRRGGAGL